jgi:hypothetical protein
MRHGEALKQLRAVENDLERSLSGGANGRLDEATVRTAASRIADLRSDIQRSRHYWLYDIAEPVARFLKVILQMGIGVTAVALIWRMVFLAWHDEHKNNLPDIEATLTVIAAALAIAAAVELAYTLFTQGPDEAIDPLMLGLASALALQLAKAKDLTPNQGLATLAYTAGLGLLFAIRTAFVKSDDQAPTPCERFGQACAWLRKRKAHKAERKSHKADGARKAS